MDRYGEPSRPPTRRKPLQDGTSTANIGHSPKPQKRYHQTLPPQTSSLSHRESSATNGSYTSPKPTASPDFRRPVTAAGEVMPDPKRVSDISTASSNTARRKTHIGPWQLGKTIGKGGCSRVRLVRHSQTHEWAAAKIISKAVAEQARAISLANLIKCAETDPGLAGNGRAIPFGLEREIVIMKLLDHQNIVKLHDVWENRNELYLIMEYVKGGELFTFIEEQNGLDEIHVVCIFRQIIAALLYCHRMHIHHRDLKPENILIDRETYNIKLVDFGMAALQPQGKWLSTPCGSPHYAAPEVLSLRQYDGSSADVWSCGVILYVMLSGLLPFNYPLDERLTDNQRQIRLYKSICSGRFHMLEHFSDEAKDLISRIFVTDPDRRISIETMWNHPFLQKYNKEFNIAPHQRSMEYWIGPRPQILNWQRLRRQDIDREILRNMRTLWHSEKEEVLLCKLLNDEHNQEKVFYSALLRHREEHLENYMGSCDSIGYSASDHQHLQPVNHRDMPPLPQPDRHQRTQSQFSILNDEHLLSSFYEPPQSEQSYDPFRASNEPVVASREGNYINVTVHRSSSGVGCGLKILTSNGNRQRDSLRLEAMKRNVRRSSKVSGQSVSLKGSPAPRTMSMVQPSINSASSRSSAWIIGSSPPSFRASNPRRRAVNFSHLRQSSTASALNSRLSMDSVATSIEKSLAALNGSSFIDSTVEMTPSPAGVRPSAVMSRKEKRGSRHLRASTIRQISSKHDIDAEARKVSTELERFCEEAFNRSSVGSTITASTTTAYGNIYETPPSSVGPSPSLFSKVQKLDKSLIENRPLPPLPIDTPRTFTMRELAETRNKLAAKYANSGHANSEYFQAVLAQLDQLLQPPPLPYTGVQDTRRAASAPQGRSPSGHLPAISEERASAESLHDDDVTSECSRDWFAHRAVTDPVTKAKPKLVDVKPRATEHTFPVRDTIRVVDHSPAVIAPLKIRKSDVWPVTTTKPRSRGGESPVVDSKSPVIVGFKAFKTPTEGTAFGFEDESSLSTADNERDVEALPVIGESVSRKKSGGWFKRSRSVEKEEERSRERPQITIPRQWQELDDRTTKSHPLSGGTRPKTSHRVDSPRQEDSPTLGKEGARRGLFKFFKPRPVKDDMGLRLASSSNLSTASCQSGGDKRDDAPSSPIIRPTEMYTNWFTRFLHIKPANKLMCFHIGRGRVRTELVRLLREWKRFGIRDISFDRRANVVQARLDKSNSLNLRPVSLVAELFVVLEHGRRAQLTIVRFTQTRGAASSFRKVVEIMERKFNDRGYLIEDEDRKRAMCDVLK